MDYLSSVFQHIVGFGYKVVNTLKQSTFLSERTNTLAQEVFASSSKIQVKKGTSNILSFKELDAKKRKELSVEESKIFDAEIGQPSKEMLSAVDRVSNLGGFDAGKIGKF